MSALTEAMQEYANAIRGDWSDFDGRSERDVIEDWIGEIDNPSDKTLEQWRDQLGLCPDGNGHWAGFKWGNCRREDCPTQVARES
ncbi:hypothetical protein [Agromyces lapidis]|uniref:Uncharacterized protein n=1 Tax=Agromyces lapidis TaxID=279574 RepID=A0ABV5SMD4_9MICO|nr:hypothetical protein [Agromyces lapidis]